MRSDLFKNIEQKFCVVYSNSACFFFFFSSLSLFFSNIHEYILCCLISIFSHFSTSTRRDKRRINKEFVHSYSTSNMKVIVLIKIKSSLRTTNVKQSICLDLFSHIVSKTNVVMMTRQIVEYTAVREKYFILLLEIKTHQKRER